MWIKTPTQIGDGSYAQSQFGEHNCSRRVHMRVLKNTRGSSSSLQREKCPGRLFAPVWIWQRGLESELYPRYSVCQQVIRLSL